MAAQWSHASHLKLGTLVRTCQTPGSAGSVLALGTIMSGGGDWVR